MLKYTLCNKAQMRNMQFEEPRTMTTNSSHGAVKVNVLYHSSHLQWITVTDYGTRCLLPTVCMFEKMCFVRCNQNNVS